MTQFPYGDNEEVENNNVTNETDEMFGMTKAEQDKIDRYLALKKRVDELNIDLELLKKETTEILQRHHVKKQKFGDYTVTVVRRNLSKFDDAKLEAFLKKHHMYSKATKSVIDEDKVEKLVSEGRLDLNEMKKEAFVEKYGATYITVRKASKKK